MSPELAQRKVEALYVLEKILSRKGELLDHDKAYLRNFFDVSFRTANKLDELGVLNDPLQPPKNL